LADITDVASDESGAAATRNGAVLGRRFQAGLPRENNVRDGTQRRKGEEGDSNSG
jgi:hypothetical protein